MNYIYDRSTFVILSFLNLILLLLPFIIIIIGALESTGDGGWGWVMIVYVLWCLIPFIFLSLASSIYSFIILIRYKNKDVLVPREVKYLSAINFISFAFSIATAYYVLMNVLMS